ALSDVVFRYVQPFPEWLFFDGKSLLPEEKDIFVMKAVLLDVLPESITTLHQDKSLSELTLGLLFPLRPTLLKSMSLPLSQGIKTAIIVQR
ncbi:TPA: hypothetical protein NDX60_004717, partial [Klebsiella pneumoniae]|nr:hypothetical protein [Klebsiella pneumoniae]